MRLFAAVFISILVFTSCKKKEAEKPAEEPTTKTTAPSYTIKDYMPLKYGNYWVYMLTITDTNNVVTTSQLDSCYVGDSTLIGTKMYYKITGGTIGPNERYYSDSANCIISDGKYLCLINNDTVSINSVSYASGDWYKTYNVMKTTPTTFVYNSNTFSNCISRYSYFFSNLNANCPNWVIHNTYCPGVGLVYSSYGYINSCDLWELKLLRYKIN